MPVLSINQLAALASNAGFSGQDVVTAVAVALAESGGDPTKYNPEVKAGAAQGQGSYGLWQIYLHAHPEFDPVQLINDPAYNASAAYTVFAQAGYSFMPWTTFKYGQYQTFLPQVQAALASSPIADQVATDGSTSGGDGGGNGGAPPPDNSTLVALAIGGALLLGAILWFKG